MTPKGTLLIGRGIVISILLVLTACSTTSSPPKQPQLTLEEIAQLTPEQIAQMDEEQLKAINQTLEPEFAKTRDLLASVSGHLGISAQAQTQRWPNYDLTLYNAVGISAETYISSVRFSYLGPEWESNACTGVPDNPLGFPFANSCTHHDFGYRNVPKYSRGRSEEVRKMIDARFLGNMKSVCEKNYSIFSSSRYSCTILAYTYYAGVRQLAQDIYYSEPVQYE
jgi:Prokaryotic phospholipase A2